MHKATHICTYVHTYIHIHVSMFRPPNEAKNYRNKDLNAYCKQTSLKGKNNFKKISILKKI